MPKPQRFCAFCGAQGMTKQHVFGKRLMAFLSNKLGEHFVIDTTTNDVKMKRIGGNIWSKQLRRVCRHCNGGWMRHLEETSFEILSSLILGDTYIPHKQQTALATRLTQMVMVADLSMPDDRLAIFNIDRRFIRTHSEPPSGWIIFLCRADVPLESGQYYHADAFYKSKAGYPRQMDKNLVATFLLGALCVHILTHPPAGYYGYGRVNLTRLWPLSGHDIDLRQSSLLSPGEIIELGASFRKFHNDGH